MLRNSQFHTFNTYLLVNCFVHNRWSMIMTYTFHVTLRADATAVMLNQIAALAQNQAPATAVGSDGKRVVLTLQDVLLMQSDKSYGKKPRDMTCPRCHTEITTETKYSSGGFAQMLCSIMVAFG